MKKEKIKNKNRKKGFTLIELLIVIAIIGILASIVLVSLNSAREKGKKASALSSIKSVMSELTMCAEDEGEAKAVAPVGGTDPICCETDTCADALTGYSQLWPDISTTGFDYDDNSGLGTSLSGGDYIYSATNATTGATISCGFATKSCQ